MVIALCLLMIFSQGYMYFDNLDKAYGVTQSDLQDAKDKVDKINTQIEETRKGLKELRQQYDDTESYIRELDKKLVSLEMSLDKLNADIESLEEEIKVTQVQLEAAQETANHQYDNMKLRIQFMYEHGEENYLAMLLASTSMSEMLNRAEYISKISNYDRQMLDEYRATVTFVEDTKAKLEADHKTLEDSKVEVEAEQASFKLMQETKKAQLEELDAQAKEYSKLENSLCAKLTDAELDLKGIEEQMKKEQESGEVSSAGKGTFYWPTQCKRVTSEFGPRWGRNHNGIDIGAVQAGVWGDPLYAAESGTVITAGWSNSAGNWIRISHGNGIITVYMHCSQLMVKVGDKVTRGQKIGTMGSTGNSTGAHLHFEVRVNGTEYKAVNPRQYISN